MFRARNRSPLLKMLGALLLGICLLSRASPASAGYSYQIFDDGVAQTAVVTPGGNAFATVLSTTHFSITIASSFTTPSQDATVLNTNLQGQLNVTGSHTIKIELNYSGYTLPAGSPETATNAGSATFTNSIATDKATFQAWGDTGNSSSFETGTTAGQQSGVSPGGVATIGIVLNPNPNSFMFTNTGQYSLSQTLSLKLGNGAIDAGQVQGTTTVTTPAPAGLLLALSAMPILGFGAWFRRRRVSTQA